MPSWVLEKIEVGRLDLIRPAKHPPFPPPRSVLDAALRFGRGTGAKGDAGEATVARQIVMACERDVILLTRKRSEVSRVSAFEDLHREGAFLRSISGTLWLHLSRTLGL